MIDARFEDELLEIMNVIDEKTGKKNLPQYEGEKPVEIRKDESDVDWNEKFF